MLPAKKQTTSSSLSCLVRGRVERAEGPNTTKGWGRTSGAKRKRCETATTMTHDTALKRRTEANESEQQSKKREGKKKAPPAPTERERKKKQHKKAKEKRNARYMFAIE
jgi:hypothetical protein